MELLSLPPGAAMCHASCSRAWQSCTFSLWWLCGLKAINLQRPQCQACNLCGSYQILVLEDNVHHLCCIERIAVELHRLSKDTSATSVWMHSCSHSHVVAIIHLAIYV